MSTIATKDGTLIYYKDWGRGPVVTFSHGWPLSSDAWDGQMLFLAQKGFRVVGHDRRGHGRSSQASSGNDMDGYADDLAAVIEALDLRDVTLVGHSTGGGEVVRYIGRHGTTRVAKAVLVAAVPPIMLRTAANPDGLPIEVFDKLRDGLTRDRSQFYRDLASPFYGANWPGGGHARRGRSDRPRQGLGEEIGEAHQGREGDLLSGRAARPHGHASGSGQRRPAGLPPELAMKIVVIGGTGLIGSKTVAILRQGGHEVVAASPNTGVNTITGEGLDEAMAGTQVVIDLANSPSFEDRAVLEFFETSGRNLLAAEAAAGVRHHVVLSIVGTDRSPDNGYFRAKVAQEKLVETSGIPYTIIRSTQFLGFLGRIAASGADGNVVRISPGLFQPIAADDVAAIVAEVALAAPRGGIVEIAGPERAPFDEIVARYLKAVGDPREVVRDPEARYFGGRVEERSLVPLGDARLGRIGLDEWLRRSRARA